MIVLATYPRSGNTYLVNRMQEILGDRMKYCESHKETFDPETHNVVKTHDFDLDFQVPAGWKVIVQLRYPPDAITSWFNLEIGHRVPEDTLAAWREFYPFAAQHYRAFCQKWLCRSNLILWHRDIVNSPSEAVSAAVREFDPTLPLPCVGLSEPPRKPSRHKNFRHYTKEDFNHLRILCRTADPITPQ